MYKGETFWFFPLIRTIPHIQNYLASFTQGPHLLFLAEVKLI